MSAVTSYCSRCGFLLESDCDFCPSCGSAKAKRDFAPPVTRDPHGWMQDSPTSPSRAGSGALTQSTVPAQVQFVAQAVPGHTATFHDTGLGKTVRTMGIVAVSLMLVGLIPCLGWLNYLNFVLSFVTLVLSIVAIASAKSDSSRPSATLGLVLVIVAGGVGFVRLIIGGGCL